MRKQAYAKVIGGHIGEDRYTTMDVHIKNPPFDITIGDKYYLIGYVDTELELKVADWSLTGVDTDLYSCTFKVMVKNYPITINKAYHISNTME